jgi:hypothetical protein
VKEESEKRGTMPLVQTHLCSLVQHDTKTKVQIKKTWFFCIYWICYLQWYLNATNCRSREALLLVHVQRNEKPIMTITTLRHHILVYLCLISWGLEEVVQPATWVYLSSNAPAPLHYPDVNIHELHDILSRQCKKGAWAPERDAETS